jgi:hypothetical protein
MADETSKEKIILDFQTNAKTVKKDTDALNVSIEQTTESTQEQSTAVKQQEESYKTFKTQLREANAELQKSIQLYGETSEQTIKAAKAVADLKDQMGFAKDLSDSFNPDQKMKALGAATQVAGTGLQGVTAGMALFGSESEDTQKQLLKVQAAMAFSDAISNLSNLGDQWQLLKATIQSSSIATKANTAATGAAAMVQNLFTGAVNTSSAGFKALKLAIAATGIGLLVVGVGLLVTNFDKVKKVVLNLVPGLEAVGDMVMSIVNAVTDFIGVTSEADRQADKLKENAKNRSKEIDRILKEDGSRYSESAKKKMAIEKQLQDDIAEGIYNVAKLRKEAQIAKDKIDQENAENEAKKIKDQQDKLAKEEQDRRDKIAAQKKQEREKELAELKAFQDDILKNQQAMNLQMVLQEQQDVLDEKERLKLQQEETTANIDALEESNDKARQKEIAEDKAVVDAKIANQQQLVAGGEQLIKNVAALAGKNKGIQKAAIIADGGISVGKAVANTAEAVTKDLAKGAPFSAPLVALDLAVGATSIASIIQGTSKALQAVGGGSAPSAPSLPRGAEGVNATPQTGFQASSENQISASINKAQTTQPIIKTYVVGSEVTDQQNLDAKLIKQNSFGN